MKAKINSLVENQKKYAMEKHGETYRNLDEIGEEDIKKYVLEV